jgi:uncharacterized membrane protein
MNQTTQSAPRPTGDTPASLANKAHWIFFGLFLLAFALAWLPLWVSFSLPGKAGWWEAVLMLTATATTLVSLSRQLPAQNVILAAAGVAFIAAAVAGIGAKTAIPFGPFTYTDEAGAQLLNVLPWPVPLIWIVAILNSRGVARLILRPWRKLRAYGFWLIGLTTVLTVLFDFGLEPFASRVKLYWIWIPTKFPLTWYGAPLVNFLGWLLATLLILAFVTPVLINKRQRQAKRPPDYFPIIVWLLAQGLFATGAFAHQLWPAASFSVAASVLTAIFAMRGARW